MRPLWWLLTRLGTIVLSIYLAWSIWDSIRPKRPTLSPILKRITDDVIPDLVEDVRKKRAEIRSVALLHLVKDHTGYVTDQIRLAIEQSNVVNLADRTASEKIRRKLLMKQPEEGELGPALEAGKRLGVDGVIFGTVRSLETTRAGARIDVEFKFYSVADRKALVDRQFSKEIPTAAAGAAALGDPESRAHLLRRLLGWILAVLLLPVFTIGFIRAMVRKESNQTNAFVLGVYTAADAALALLLFGAGFGSWLYALFFLLLLASALFYNIAVTSFAIRLES